MEAKKVENIEKLNSPMWFINFNHDEEVPEKISFNMILNLASVCNAESCDILWGFIENYYPKVDKRKNLSLQRLLEFGVQYYKKFVLPQKKYRSPTEIEKKGFKELIIFLDSLSENAEAEDIQTKIYDIGMTLKYENLKDWFSAFYEVILGQNQGPRLGSFIKFYGITETSKLLESKLKE